MDEGNTALWYEDLESRRGPSLYYLTSEDDPRGPFFIIGWDGVPTNYDEFDVDVISKIVEEEPCVPDFSSNSNACDIDGQLRRNEPLTDEPGDVCPAQNVIPSNRVTVEGDDCSLNFLSLPPDNLNLMTRLVKLKRASDPKKVYDNDESSARVTSTMHVVDAEPVKKKVKTNKPPDTQVNQTDHLTDTNGFTQVSSTIVQPKKKHYTNTLKKNSLLPASQPQINGKAH